MSDERWDLNGRVEEWESGRMREREMGRIKTKDKRQKPETRN
jgi:hypothetical protein